MARGGDGRIVLWPRYFDQSLSRSQGRRVPGKLAVSKPDSAWIRSAAKKAGYDAEHLESLRHPSRPAEAVGAVKVTTEDGKETVLHAVAAQMANK